MRFLKLQGYGVPPYSLNIKNTANTDIYNISNLTGDDITIPNNISDLLVNQASIFRLTDSLNNTSTKVFDPVTLNLKRKYYKGIAITNGNEANHLEAIQKSIDRGLSYVGVIYNLGEATDSSLNLLINGGAYDHTTSGTYLIPFDEVVRKAYLSSPAGVENRVVLKVQILLTRDDNKLNNGTTRTLFFNESDLSKRSDGTYTIQIASGVIGNVTVGSYAATNIQVYADRILQAFMKRYLSAINDGTILCIGLGNTRAAEGEYESTLVDNNGTITGFSSGDFHPSMISAFKIAFPQYNLTSNNDIANADLTNSDLGKRWYKFLSNYLAKFESDRIANAITAIPDLTRTQWWLRDVGSYMDGQAGRRRTWNSSNLMHPKTMVVKCNDAPNDDGTNNFILDELTSLASKVSAISICEPTPPNHDFVNEYYRGIVRAMTASAVARGVGLSFISSTDDALNFYINSTALNTAPVTPNFKNDFKIIGGVPRTFGHTFNLSDIVAAGNTSSSWRTSYENFKTDNGITTPSTLPIDNII